MNKSIIAFVLGVMVLTGAGCIATNWWSSSDGSVEGRWQLAFDLPSGWVMVNEYSDPRNDVVVPSQEVARDAASVILQSTDKAIVTNGMPSEDVPSDTYVTSDYTMIHVYKMDARTVVPKEAVDLGDGFFMNEDKYYFVTPLNEKYLFTLSINGQDRLVAEEVVRSAQVVTAYRDTVSDGATK